MSLQLLAHPKVQNGKRYVYYSIAEGFRSEGKSRKRVLAHLGLLTSEQAETLRLALKMRAHPDYQILRPQEVECQASVSYLDVAVFEKLWREMNVSSVMKAGKGDVSLSELLEILVLNRCCDPKSKLGVTRWYPTTALDRLLGIPATAVEESRLYRCLSSIAAHQTQLEEHLWKQVQRIDDSSSLYCYDLSSSYFEGECVSMAAFNQHSKDHRPDRLQVVLGLLMNEQGLPFSWDLFRGNQGDAPTLKAQLKKFKERFRIENATCVFDRGFLSADNLRLVEEAGFHYVTGLDAPQIETLLIKQNWLSTINTDTCEKIVSKQKNWQRFDDTQFYCSLGIVNDRQTILLFDVARYRKSIFERQEKIEAFKLWVTQHNEWLSKFKKHAEKVAIEKDIDAELKKRNLSPYVTYELHEITTDNHTFIRRKNNPYPSQGYMKKVRSFQTVVKEHNHRQLDGVFALITSIGSPLNSQAVIQAYRQKYLIEAAFREMKSILKLRPWFVYKEDHVKAHYTICVLAYFLERLLDLKLDKAGLKEQGWTLGQLKAELQKIHLVDLKIGKTTRSAVQSVPSSLKTLLATLKLNPVLKPNLSSMWNR